MNLKTSKVTITRKGHYSVAHLGTQSRDVPVIEVSAQIADEREKKKRNWQNSENWYDNTRQNILEKKANNKENKREQKPKRTQSGTLSIEKKRKEDEKVLHINEKYPLSSLCQNSQKIYI